MGKTLNRPKVMVDANDIMINDNTLQWQSFFSKEGGSVITTAAYAKYGETDADTSWAIIRYTLDSAGDIVRGKAANGKFDMVNVLDNGDQAVVSGATQANPGVITVATTAYTAGDLDDIADGDVIEFTGVAGMVELNSNFYIVDNWTVGAKTMTLTTLAGVAVDTTGFTTYTSGGVIHKRTFSNYSVS